MKEILIAVAVVGGTGLVFGCLLAFASMIFYVKQDERVTKIIEVLPGANCGSCGYAGCGAYAEAVVNGLAPVNGCSVGKGAVAQSIATVMGVEAGAVQDLKAKVMCAGNYNHAHYKYEYVGINDCLALSKLAGGSKSCPNGCLGMGTCTTVCQFGAISVQDGVAVVDEEKCTGCGACVRMCPKQVIALIPKDSPIQLNCSNTEKGAFANKHCSSSCIACRICERTCTHDAIHVENNLVRVDYEKCVGCGECAAKCPHHVIGIRN